MADLTPADQRAIAAAKAGWYVFPIRKGDKKPPLVAHWREESSNDPEQVVRWTQAFPLCNWGLDCGRSGLTVLDIDGDGGMKTLTQYEIEHGGLPRTFTVGTPRGGLHYYFRGVSRTTVRALGPELDTRGEGGYVVLPESLVGGRKYWIKENARPEKIPDWLKGLLKRSAPKTPAVHEHVEIPLDTPSAVERATAFLTERAGSIQGEGGDHWAYRTFCVVRDMGISEKTAVDLALLHWNVKCEPEWSLEELQTKARNAYKYAENPVGAATPEADFAAVEIPESDEPEVEEREHDCPLPGSTIFKMYPKDREWLVDGWLPVGEIASLYGDGGQGKSLIGLQLAVDVALGRPWYGVQVGKPAMAFCVFCEDTKEEVNRRLHSVMRGCAGEFAMDRLRIWCRPGKSSVLATAMPNGELIESPFFVSLKKHLMALKNEHKLVILDTLADIYSGSEMNREHVSRFIKVCLRGLARDTNSTILILAHPSRAGMKEGDLLSGSTAWSNSVRMRWSVRPHKENPDIRILERMKSNYSARGETLLLSWDAGRFVSIQESAVDDVPVGFEADTKIVMAKIVRAAAAGSPYGTRAQTNPITKITIRDGKSRVMASDYITKCVDYLIKMGYVENCKKGNRKALYPVGVSEDSVFTKIT